MVLMREVQKKKGPIRGPEPVTTYITVKYIYILPYLAWLLAPFVE